MSRRVILVATTAALMGATVYSAIDSLDDRVSANFRRNVANFVSDPVSFFKNSEVKTTIAQKYGGTDPHGDDPHGDDPHDEIHDSELPANANRNVGKAPKDVYGGTVPNDQKPY